MNHLSVGRIPDGAQVERSVPNALQEGSTINLSLEASDFQTARKVAKAINQHFGPGIAQALDGRVVQVQAPQTPNERVNFIAEMEELAIENPQAAAKVVINSRTGSIVLNQAVTLGACAIAHGNLSISISSTPVVSQPGAMSGGQTVVTSKTSIDIKQEPGKLIQLPAAAQLSEVVKALNSLGATPQDLLAILQAIKSAGALNAELENAETDLRASTPPAPIPSSPSPTTSAAPSWWCSTPARAAPPIRRAPPRPPAPSPSSTSLASRWAS